jgi:hypothetical protein
MSHSGSVECGVWSVEFPASPSTTPSGFACHPFASEGEYPPTTHPYK